MDDAAPTTEELRAARAATWEADVVLRDGAVAHVRPIRPDDRRALAAFHRGQSERSRYLRFFAAIPELSDRDLDRFTQVDHDQRVALVAEIGGEIIAIARFDRIDPTTAEVAFNVADEHQGRGLGSVMLEHLAAIGDELGLGRFTADVLPENRQMMNVFTEAGYEVAHRFEDGVITVSFDIEPNEHSREVRESREQRAEARSMVRVLRPESVVMIGVSRREETIGHKVLAEIVAGGYQGRLEVVHPEVGELAGITTTPSVREVTGPIDLAIIALPADTVHEVVADCAAIGVRSVLVVSAGFAEAGPEGARRQRELLRLVRYHGMRLVGPNSYGLSNSSPEVSLNATLGAPSVRGRFGLFAQSGALGVSVTQMARQRGVGLSTFVSAGNRADVSGNDVMQYWMEDDDTAAVGLYLETLGNARKFFRISQRLSAKKPIIAIKSGTSGYGVPPGHLIRRSRAQPEALDAMLRQSGIIRVSNLHQMFNIAQLVLHQPLPAGRGVAVVGNSTSLAALAADACMGWGLQVAREPHSLPHDASMGEIAEALHEAFEDPTVHAVLAVFIPPLVGDGRDVARTVAQVALDHEKPCLTTMTGMDGVNETLSATKDTPDGPVTEVVPAYMVPEDAVRALNAVERYAAWRRSSRGELVAPEGIDWQAIDAAQEIATDALLSAPAGRELRPEETSELLAAVGIELATGSGGEPAGGWPSDAVPLVVGATEDPLFGPVVSLRFHGSTAALLGTPSYRVPPLTDADVHDLVDSLQGSRLLAERGVDRAALEELIARVSVLADAVPELAELELSPVEVTPHGVVVHAARATVERPEVRQDARRRSISR